MVPSESLLAVPLSVTVAPGHGLVRAGVGDGRRVGRAAAAAAATATATAAAGDEQQGGNAGES